MKRYRQLLGLVLAVTVLGVAAFVLFLKPGAKPVDTVIVLSQTAIALPGKAAYGDGLFTVQLESIPGNTAQVQVSIMGPGGVIGEWRQGLGSESYRFESRSFFVDVLSIMDDKIQATDVTVSVRREL